MAGMTEPFISLRNVRKVYRAKDQEFLAVSDVTMDVAEGELVSLVGPSGCGKTTVLKILAGLHEADGGTVRIGNAATPFDPARDIGMVDRKRHTSELQSRQYLVCRLLLEKKKKKKKNNQ